MTHAAGTDREPTLTYLKAYQRFLADKCAGDASAELAAATHIERASATLTFAVTSRIERDLDALGTPEAALGWVTDQLARQECR